jgi:DmsE family decaheme c-type cytochrome
MNRLVLGLAALSLAGTTAAAAEATPAADLKVGSDACLACHEDHGQSLRHFGASPGVADCESCHGPGKAHVDGGGDATKIISPAKLSPIEQSKSCLACHSGTHELTDWTAGRHEAANVTCLSCHAVHNAAGKMPHLLKQPRAMDVCFTCHKMQRVQTMMSSHMPLRENKMDCTDCHNPHGTPTRAMLREPSVNDNCYACHAEKRGPVLFEHPPVRENCLNCHTPHGSLHPNLLIAEPPRLCQSCHIGTRHPSQPQTPTSRFVFNKSCVNCHPSIHGSNDPNGVRMMR